MKKGNLTVIAILFACVLIVSGAGAFEIGENRVENGDFETGEVGSTPAEWELRVTG